MPGNESEASNRTAARNGAATTEPTSFQPPAITLPKGGGAIRGIGEKFAANPVTGTGSLSVPIAVSPGRAGFGPQLSLSYDSGAGNGPFGFGWSLGLPQITRKTDKGLPRYDDAAESDVFLLSGAEDLVPVAAPDDTTSFPGYRIRRYRPRVEGLFARIERWTKSDGPDAGDVYWRSISKDNVLTLYGKDANSRIADPADARRVFSWLICETRDDRGNAVVYDYKAEDTTDLDLRQAHEANRGDATDPRRRVNRTIKHIRYGNRVPLLDGEGRRPAHLTPAQIAAAGWMFQVVFDYGDHDPDAPTPAESRPWPRRNDPFSTYRPGFEVRTYRLCRRVLLFHHFPDEPDVLADCLVRSTDFTYAHEQTPDAARDPVYSCLLSITQSGYRRDGAGYRKRSLPPLAFEYTRPVVQSVVEEVDGASLENLPAGLNGSYQWTDLHGEGVPGILTEQGGAWFYKRNLSTINRQTRDVAGHEGIAHLEARFAPVELVAARPNQSLGGGAQFMDLAGDGQPDLVVLDGPLPGLYEHDEAESWAAFRPFAARLNRALSDPNLRFVDLDGDGHADVLITEDDALVWHPSLAEAGFGPAQRAPQPRDEERGPRLVFADGSQSIYLADLSGDGLTDLARVRNGEVCYWPNLGYGRFGAKVTMDNAPWFDNPDQFEQRRVRLADIDGSGTTDLIYLHRDGVRLYFNQSGNGWGEAQTLDIFPPTGNLTDVVATDLLGNGTACLVWSSPLPGDARRPMRYVNLMGDEKPHLLVRIVNNLGAETRLHYAPSTKFYLQDRQTGRPWITRLPFPVHVVERVETYDHVSRSRFVTTYAYHHGYFDGEEREFRGFGMVEQTDTEAFAALTASGALPPGDNDDAAGHVPPVLTRTWYHTGVYLGRDNVSRFFAGLFDATHGDEYYREPAWRHDDDEAAARLLDDTILPDNLTIAEEREAARALKGLMLRQEVYALDGVGVTPDTPYGHPYTVAEQNFTVRRLQPRGERRHAVFFSHPREALTTHYEREPANPRRQHALTLAVDGYGNVLKSATVGYGRRASPLGQPWDRERQTTTLVTYSENDVTLPLDDPAAHPGDHRAPLPAESRTYELTGLALAPGGRFTLAGLLADGTGATPIPYEQPPTAGQLEKRLIERVRTLYRADDLSALLPPRQMGRLALPGETIKLALTPGVLAQVFSRDGQPLLPADPGPLLTGQGEDGGGYAALDGGWWVASGRVFYHPQAVTAAAERAEAQAHFFLPRRFRDPFGHETTVEYDAHDLLPARTTDAAGNATLAQNDYRVLQPRLLTDPNRNRAAAAFDALGLVVGTAVMGKPAPAPAEGDSLAGFQTDPTPAELDAFFAAADPRPLAAPLLGSATTRILYDLDGWARDGRPACAATLARESHVNPPSPGDLKIQLRFSYADGFGREAQKKLPAEPGPTPRRAAAGQIVLSADGQPEMTAADTDPRWVGSGWTIFNNKGKPVRQYEPFFSDSQAFEFGVRVGVSPILFYDPPGRVVATIRPDHSWEKVVFDPWQQATYDANDTVTLDPAADADVRGFLARLPEAAHRPTWHALRTDPAHAAALAARYPDATLRAAETTAATQAAAHAGTPTIAHFDALGRPFLTLADNGPDPAQPGQHALFASRVELDIEGNQRQVRDAIAQTDDPLGRAVMRFAYDMLGTRLRQSSMEAGERWTLNDAAGKSIRAFDSRGFTRRLTYDALRRPTGLFVTENGAERLAERTVYGEGQGDETNHRGRVYQVCDGAGIVTSDAYDFKGNLLAGRREMVADYQTAINWLNPPPAMLETFTSRTAYDALNRPTAATTPDGSVYRATFNEANLLERVEVELEGATPATPFVTDIDYDARGQRQAITYANGATTTTTYDPLTFRLTNLRTTRPAGPNGLGALFANATVVQNLRYTYDPAGNISRIEDAALPTIFHNNEQVAPVSSYTYDALYRLIEATGREHIAQTGHNFGPPPPGATYRDHPFFGLRANPNDPTALRTYTERYEYDAVGNFTTMRHVAANGSWTRAYTYDEASLLEPAKRSNRLSSTQVGDDHAHPAEAYTYDAHGNVTRLPHLGGAAENLRWDFEDQLQRVDLPGGETAHYLYDAAGQRARKVIAADDGTPREERLYLGGYEVYRRHTGADAGLERRTLHVMDDKQRIALVETRNNVNDGTPPRVIRYQLGNHLGSAALELAADAALISYEEYHPYGTTAFQAARADVEVAAKRYRYTGMERDEETGLSYHTTRYYAPWLGRWTAADPAGLVDGPNLYRYSRNNPIRLADPNGMDPPRQEPPVRVTPLLTDVAPTGIAGSFQVHDLLSSRRSVSGRGAVSGGVRSSFIFDVPRLNLSTTGFADLSGTAAIDTAQGRAGLQLQGGLLLGDLSGLNLAARGEATLSIPVPERLRVSGLPGSLLAGIPQGEGTARLSGALSLGSTSLADFRATATLAGGRFQGRLDATSIGDFGRLRLDAGGRVNADGGVTLDSARLRATVDVPGINLEARGTGVAAPGGGLALRANADLRLLGLPSLHLEGSGSASAAGVNFAGRFYGPGPLFTSYITGGFNLSSETGISGHAGVFGLTYTPGVSVTDPAPPSPGLSAIAGAPANPWTPSGLTLGASYFHYSQGLITHVSGGFMPDLSERVLSNPRLGVTAQFHF